MAKKQARVLVDLPQYGCKADQILEADESVIKALAADGAVDPHKDAVAYARSHGADVVRSAAELAAEKAAEKEGARKALQAEIATLQEQLTKATESEAKTALEQQIAEKQAAIAALG
jgi:hypothetical protein